VHERPRNSLTFGSPRVFPATSALSEMFLYSSRVSHPGLGYPSASRDLSLVAPNTNDPNGYYRMLDLPPWASEREIVSRCRILLRECHPDGPNPDPDRFRRIEEIYRILSNTETRISYHRVPVGERYVDSEYKEQLKEHARQYGMSMDEVEEIAKSQEAASDKPEEGWDYFSVGIEADDHELAQEWYVHLLVAAYEVGYHSVIKVLLGDEFRFDRGSGIIRVPRSAVPTHVNAFHAVRV
jgi:hypothetical protein